MYKVQNLTRGCLSFSLERGSIVLQPGHYWDLDGICSRKWIRSNEMLSGLLKRGAIRVVHDSEAGIPKMAMPVENTELSLPEIPVFDSQSFMLAEEKPPESILVQEEQIDNKFELSSFGEATSPLIIESDGKTENIQIWSFENNILKIQELAVISTECPMLDKRKNVR